MQSPKKNKINLIPTRVVSVIVSSHGHSLHLEPNILSILFFNVFPNSFHLIIRTPHRPIFLHPLVDLSIWVWVKLPLWFCCEAWS